MVGKLNKLSKSLLHLSDPMSSTPFGDTVSWMTVLPAVALPCLSTRHRLSLVTVYPRYSRLTLLFTQVFTLKVTLEELFYTVVSNIPPASLLFALYVHVCMFVQTPLKSLDGKSTLVTILMSLAHETLLACVNNWETFVNILISMSTMIE